MRNKMETPVREEEQKIETPAGAVLEKIKKIKLGDPLEEIVAHDFDDAEPNIESESEEGGKRELDPAEREKLANDMGKYVAGLEEAIVELEADMKVASAEHREELRWELDDLKLNAEGLGEFVEEISETESITERSIKE